MDALNIRFNHYELHSTINPVLQALQESPHLQILKPSSTADGLAVLLFLLASVGYLTRGRFWDKRDPCYQVYFERPQVAANSSTNAAKSNRDIAKCIEDGDYHCVIFWGSQSGTAERFAETLGRECHARFGINALVADLSDYDAESIASIQEKHFVIFLLSTYGEGDPSDNTAGLWDWIKRVHTGSIQLGNLRYFAFGLGNSNYKYYNRVLDVVADALNIAGATALMPRQKADDANGATEEDFQAWTDGVFALFRSMGYEQKSNVYQPSIDIKFNGQIDKAVIVVTSSIHQPSSNNSPIVPLGIRGARELFTGGDRNCIHIELDLGNTDLVYKTGDHIGIWPCNPDEEVDRLLDTLGLQHCREDKLTIASHIEAGKSKIPSPTNLDTAFRHHLEICGPVSRKVVAELAQFAPTPDAKAFLLNLGHNRDQHEQLTANTHMTLARLLQYASPTEPWRNLPLSFVIENLLSLQPRYYSISSSSVISPRRIAVTALVVNRTLPSDPVTTICGLASNYLLSSSQLAPAGAVPTATYRKPVPAEPTQYRTVLAHVRKSKFKLPITSSTPIVLISAGTGFAPFRAFIQERAKLHAIGKPIGKIVIFFGCRDETDYIYRDEMQKTQDQLGDKLEIITAFSRQGGSKVYVQDRVGEHASKVLGMLEAGANMYICGKASMAREVDAKLEGAAANIKQLTENEVKAWADALKKRGKWKADVWG
ncbi:cytochrome P450 reductase 2 [Setomelanomma holmii]|uniref:NADPH--cytochrome P450 reductase n=1 Tax=Setomelanomma holmii TaxID=210430 RepID=A0A9P4HDM9_9PLEO|nr:cytochrome P450 reductase 2 [Setomelanomma holmii]